MFVLSKLFPRFFQKKRDKQSDKSQVTDIDKNMPCLGEKPKDLRCKLLLLDDTEIVVDVKSTAKAQAILNRVFEHLNLLEKDYFGLRFLDSSNQTHWLDPAKAVGAQLKSGGAIIHTLYFGVKFYAADPCKLHEEITRYQFFLQVKRDILQGRLPVQFDVASELCAYAVQSELGDYDPKRHTYGYISEFRFLPNQSEDLENRIVQIHRTLAGQVPAVAEYRFLDKVKWLEMYGVDLHPVQGEGNIEYFVGLTPTGVVVFRNKSKVGNYFWPRITKVTFKAKMFMVRVKDKNNDENTYAFECSTKQACKHLWRCCVEHHAFFRLSQASNSFQGAGKLFSFGSKHRYSGRTERQVLSDGMNRQAPQVMRTPSKRHQRRPSTEGKPADLNQISTQGKVEGPITTVLAPEPVKTPSEQRKSYSGAPDSPRSTRSAPWETGHHRKGRGLYTSGRESPLSVRSDKMMFPAQRRNHSGSESESGHHRKSHHRRRESDYDSDASSRRQRRRRSRHAESGTESEPGHRRHRHSRRSTENMTYTESQWKDVQRRVRDGTYGPEYNGKVLRPNGSMNSMPGSEASHQRRKRRGRSRSPGTKKPPEELAQHFKYVEPEPGLTQDQLRDIPYTKVETATEQFPHKHSPHMRHRHKSPHRRRSYGESSEKGRTKENIDPHNLPKEEPPPPYSGPLGPSMPQYNRHSNPYLAYNDPYRSRGEMDEMVQAPVSAYSKNEAHTAPIVKTKPVAVQYTAMSPGSHFSHGAPAGYTAQLPERPVMDSRPHSSHEQHGMRGVKHPRDDSGLGIDNDPASRVGSSQGSPSVHHPPPLNNNNNKPVSSYKVISKPMYIEQASSEPSNISHSGGQQGQGHPGTQQGHSGNHPGYSVGQGHPGGHQGNYIQQGYFGGPEAPGGYSVGHPGSPGGHPGGHPGSPGHPGVHGHMLYQPPHPGQFANNPVHNANNQETPIKSLPNPQGTPKSDKTPATNHMPAPESSPMVTTGPLPSTTEATPTKQNANATNVNTELLRQVIASPGTNRDMMTEL